MRGNHDDQKVTGSERRTEIVVTATTLFHEKGYLATSLDDVAECIGFTKPAIYYYFKKKDDILFAIVDRIVTAAWERVEHIVRSDGSASERLHDLLVENTRVILDNIEANTVFYNSQGMLSPERERDVRERERAYMQLVRQLYVEGVESGELLGVDPSLATSTLLGASIWTYRWYDEEGRLSRRQVAHEVADLAMRGFRKGHHEDS